MTLAGGRLAAGLSAALYACGCGGPPGPPRSPEDAGRALAAWARLEAAAPASAAGFVDDALLARHGAALVDAAAVLRGAGLPEVRAVAAIDGGDRVAVDFESSAGGGGRIRFSVTAVRGAGGAYKIVAFSGPGAGWPPVALPAGEGLSTSPPPHR